MRYRFEVTFTNPDMGPFGIAEVTYYITSQNRFTALQELSSILMADERIKPSMLLAGIAVTNVPD